MTDRLNHLKNEMDNTVLKQIQFSENNKVAVREHFKGADSKRKAKYFPQLVPIISICCTMLLIGLIGFITIKEPNQGELQNVPTKPQETSTILSAPQESFEQLSKDEVLDRLLNSVDYFETAAGTFETFDAFYDGSTSKTKVIYKYSNNEVVGGYQKDINYRDENNPHAEYFEYDYYYLNDTFWMLNVTKNHYIVQPSALAGQQEKVNAQQVFDIDLYKLYDSEHLFRERLPLTGNLFDYEFVAKYLRFEDQWYIEKQDEELLGHNTMVIHGQIDASIRDMNHVQPNEASFRIWVDKDTGIMMKRELYNDAGDIISSISPASLEINTVFEEEEFIPALEGFENRSNMIRNVDNNQENEVKVVEHADTIASSVEKVMQMQRETMPYYYAFNGPKITPFSASIEEYQGQKQAYVVYSYDKPNTERGSGSRLLYTRIYPQDAIVRTTGDFERELGEEIARMTLAEIDWHIYEVDGTPNLHLKGERAGFIYEIVAEEVSLQEIKALLESNYK